MAFSTSTPSPRCHPERTRDLVAAPWREERSVRRYPEGPLHRLRRLGEIPRALGMTGDVGVRKDHGGS